MRVPALVMYMLLLLVVAVIPDDGRASHWLAVPSSAQNALHVPAYGLLAWLWISVLESWGRAGRRGVVVAAALSVACGALLELCQVWIPGRSASLWDFAADASGALLVAGLYSWIGFTRTASTSS